MKNFASQLHFSERLPSADQFASAVVVYDRVLVKKNLEFKKWIAKFKRSYGVEAGEKLKDFDQFATHLKKLNKLATDLSPRTMQVVAIGGGSVGDFAGFFASIFKRGVRLTHFPTTYLSAVDSAHGGKTALNLSGGKNQIGSFYPASEVWIIGELLQSQSESQLADARGELAKIALIDKRVWKLVSKKTEIISFVDFIKLVRPAVEAKMRIVLKDPFEQSGLRQVLNLGHTLGHVIEASSGLSHGAAVAQGLLFSVRWSNYRGLLPKQAFNKIEAVLSKQFSLHTKPIVLKKSNFETLIRKDKKRSSKDCISFVFVKSPGKVCVEEVEVNEILREAKRQGWVK